MAKRRSLLKWSVIACIAIIVPAVAVLVAIYLLARSGAAKRALGNVWRSACIGKIRAIIISRKLRGCKGLERASIEMNYYRTDDGAPFVAIVDRMSIKCVSAISTGDIEAKRLIEIIQRVIGLASTSASEVVFFVKASRQGTEGKIVVGELSDGTEEGIAVAGALAWRIASSILALIEGLSPASAASICVGEEVVRSLATGGAA